MRGPVFAVGGRESNRLLGDFISLCGGGGARIVVITTASTDPERKAQQYHAALHELSVPDRTIFHPDRAAAENDQRLLEAIERADGVYFSGGGQRRLVGELAGTRLIARVFERFRAGLPIGGTSAGATAMGAVMISRDTNERSEGAGTEAGERADKEAGKEADEEASERPKAFRLDEGFGALPGMMIDQHLRERRRLPRLIEAISRRPDMIGVGLDEDTAVCIDARDRMTVFGSGRANLVYATGDAEASPPATDAPQAAGLRIEALQAGDVVALEEISGHRRD